MGKQNPGKIPTTIKSKDTLSTFEGVYFLFLILLPFVYSDALVDPVLIARQLYLSVFLLLISSLIIKKVVRKELTFDLSFLKMPVFWVMAIFLITILISVSQSLVLSESYYLFSKIGVEMVFCLLTCFLIIQEQLRIQILIKAMVVLTVIVLAMALLDLLKLFPQEGKFSELVYEVKGTFGHKNLLSSLLILLFPFLWISSTFSKKWRIAAVFLGGSLLMLVWILQTRAAIIAVLIFFLVLTLLFVTKRKEGKALFSPTKLLVGLLVLAVGLGAFTYYNKEKFARIFNTDSAYERIAMWENSVDMIRENPVLGVGAGNWQIHFPENGLEHFPDEQVRNGLTTFQRPHNDFLWVFSEMGIIGIVSYLSIFGVVLYLGFRGLKMTKNEKEKALFPPLLAGIFAYLFIAFIDFPFERIEHQLVLTLLFSLIISSTYRLRINDPNLPTSKLHNFMLLPLMILLIFSFLVSINRMNAERHVHLLYEAHRTANWQEMIHEVDAAQSRWYEIDATSVPLDWYKGVALFSLGKYEDAQSTFEQALRLHPFNIHVLNNLASCYEKQGNHQKAIHFYRRALAISGHFEEAILNLSAVYFNQKKYKKALETIVACHIYSQDPKYKIFVPAIVGANIEIYLPRIKEVEIKNLLLDVLKSDEKKTQLYYAFKNKNCTFDHYILTVYAHD